MRSLTAEDSASVLISTKGYLRCKGAENKSVPFAASVDFGIPRMFITSVITVAEHVAVKAIIGVFGNTV